MPCQLQAETGEVLRPCPADVEAAGQGMGERGAPVVLCRHSSGGRGGAVRGGADQRGQPAALGPEDARPEGSRWPISLAGSRRHGWSPGNNGAVGAAAQHRRGLGLQGLRRGHRPAGLARARVSPRCPGPATPAHRLAASPTLEHTPCAPRTSPSCRAAATTRQRPSSGDRLPSRPATVPVPARGLRPQHRRRDQLGGLTGAHPFSGSG